jgi:hypothetical protein
MSEAGYSHPDQAVKHSYPLAVTEDGFSSALSLCLKTSPYMLARFGILVGFTVAAIVWVALCGGLAALFTNEDGEGGGAILFLFGIAGPAGVFVWLKRYVLYLLKAGHIAVLTKLITDGKLPDGVNQVEYGKSIVTEKFAQTNVLFVLDSLITGIVRAFNRTLDWIASMIPIPGVESLVKFVNGIIHMATTFIDETVFSYNLARGDENVWRSSSDAVVYYGQNVKPVLKTAVVALILEYVLSFVLFLVCLVPAYLIGTMLPDSVSGWAWIVAILLALNIRAAFLHPIFLTMVALTFHKNVQGQEIDQSMADKLSSVSDKFQELTRRAKEWVEEKMGSKGEAPVESPAG